MSDYKVMCKDTAKARGGKDGRGKFRRCGMPDDGGACQLGGTAEMMSETETDAGQSSEGKETEALVQHAG